MICCSTEIYIKTKRYTKSNLAPFTREEELRQKLLEMIGEEFVKVDAKFCPFCGKKLEGEVEH